MKMVKKTDADKRRAGLKVYSNVVPLSTISTILDNLDYEFECAFIEGHALNDLVLSMNMHDLKIIRDTLVRHVDV